MDKVDRRLDLLKLEELGFSWIDVVKELSQKLTCPKRVLYEILSLVSFGNLIADVIKLVFVEGLIRSFYRLYITV